MARDALIRFVGAGLEPALYRISTWQTHPWQGTLVVVGISRDEWLRLLASVYGADHPKTIRHRTFLMGNEA
jgi:hypothetical protein